MSDTVASAVVESEQRRLNELLKFEQAARSQGYRSIAGIDEAGRGPLAGPVVAAACIIPEKILFPGLDDSKRLSERQREVLFQQITTHPEVIYGVGIVDAQTIDAINIFQATIVAMLEAVKALSSAPDYLLVDGLKLPHPEIPTLKIIRGDSLSHSIAAASVIAKVTRDKMMLEYDLKWPEYEFKKHKGYGTARHMAALAEHGTCPIHRMTFAPCSSIREKFLST